MGRLGDFFPSATDNAAIVQAVEAARTISRHHKQLIISAL
jgi:hypothetical protein